MTVPIYYATLSNRLKAKLFKLFTNRFIKHSASKRKHRKQPHPNLTNINIIKQFS